MRITSLGAAVALLGIATASQAAIVWEITGAITNTQVNSANPGRFDFTFDAAGAPSVFPAPGVQTLTGSNVALANGTLVVYAIPLGDTFADGTREGTESVLIRAAGALVGLGVSTNPAGDLMAANTNNSIEEGIALAFDTSGLTAPLSIDKLAVRQLGEAGEMAEVIQTGTANKAVVPTQASDATFFIDVSSLGLVLPAGVAQDPLALVPTLTVRAVINSAVSNTSGFTFSGLDIGVIPEPSSAALLALAGATGLRRRRR